MPLGVIWHSAFFWLFALLTCGFGLLVLIEQNIVRMALFLIAALSATAGLFFLSGAQFLGAMQIMIYVGGTLVLLVFGVMLTAQQAFVSMRTSGGEWVLGIVVGAALLALLVSTTFSVAAWQVPHPTPEQTAADDIESTAPLGLALLGIRVDRLESGNPGGDSLSGYLLPFEIVSVHLLVVLIGAAYLARTKLPIARRSTSSP